LNICGYEQQLKFNKMDNTEKARELISKHLYLHGGDDLGIADGDVYSAVLDAVSEALTIPDVGQSKQLVCPECKSTDCKTAIHTDYKECNKCYHYWEAS
jgi:protein-arginine kinase activator protein McsA